MSACLAVAAVSIMWWDVTIARFNRHGDIPGDLRRMIDLCEIFAHGLGAALVVLGIFIFSRDHRPYLFRIATCAFWPGLVVQAVKLFVPRTRPGKLAEFPQDIASTFGESFFLSGQWNEIYDLKAFPSGHAAAAFGLAVGLTWLYPKGKWFFFGVAFVASLQRIMAGAHWSSDVLFGAAVGVLCAGAVTQNWGLGWILGKIEDWFIRPTDVDRPTCVLIDDESLNRRDGFQPEQRVA